MSKAYHHGDLRDALIAEALGQLRDRPADAVSVADAARALGVSSGAPYRHFKDRDTLLAHLAAAGFDRLRARMEEAAAEEPAGSIDRIVALGCAYIAFSAENPNLFHLMWSAPQLAVDTDVARLSGKACYAGFIEALAQSMAANGFADRAADAFGAPLWTMVHGYASLVIGRAPALDGDPSAIRAQVSAATHAYFGGMAAQPAPQPELQPEPEEAADPAPLPDPFRGGCVAFGLRRASRVVTRRFETAMRPLALTAFQFTALVALSGRASLAQTTLAEIFGMSLSTLNRNIGPLKARGAVAVAPDPEDRRVRRVSITDAGRALLAEAVPHWQASQQSALDRLGEGRWDAIRTDLRRLVN